MKGFVLWLYVIETVIIISKTKALETIAGFKGRLNKDYKFSRDEENEDN